MIGKRLISLTLSLVVITLVGCGTTRWTDTGRAATEQLLISDAMDRAVSRLDLRALAGRTVFLDTTHIKGVTDSDYLISTLRQHMLATGCILRDAKGEADYVAEVRVGAVGTDRNEMMFGVPSVSLPVPVPVTGVPTSIPEMQFAKKTKQRAVVKMAMFAYNVKTGRPVWQSGIFPVESTAKDVWIAGAGPFQTGTIYDRATFAGDEIDIPLIDFHSRENRRVLAVADDAFFVDEIPEEEEPDEEAVAQTPESPATGSPPTAQTAQAEPKSPPNAPDPGKKTPVDPQVVPASLNTPPSEQTTPPSAEPVTNSVPQPETTSLAPAPSEQPPGKIAPSLALRLPSREKPAETANTSGAPPLPEQAANTNVSPPRLLDLDGVKPIPLRFPHQEAAKSSGTLGLPPLPQAESTRAARAPASLTSGPILP